MILTLLFLWSMVTAQQPPPPAANDLGVIKGTVVDLDGKPVEGANVYVGGFRASVEGENLPTLNSRNNGTTSNANGEFVLDRVIPSKSVIIHAYMDTDYYALVLWAFNLPPKMERPEVEVKPGQTVTGVTVRLTQRAAHLHLYVRDADTNDWVNGLSFLLCREDSPTERGYCSGGSGSSDFVEPVPVGVGFSIKIEAYDGKHEKWEYHDSKTGSRYFRAKSGEIETINVYLRGKRQSR